MILRILIAGRATKARRRLERLLDSAEVSLSSASSNRSLWSRLGRENWDVLITLPDVLEDPASDSVLAIRALPDAPEVVLVIDRDSPEERAQLLTSGVMAAVDHTLTDARLTQTLRAVLERVRAASTSASRARSSERYSFGDFASESPTMQELLELAGRVAAADTSLLILGETGVGKEWLARAIHAEGARAGAPFVAVNCTALPEGLLESELFGHMEGAFTGAHRSRRGDFELAHGGTIFLDEIGDMPLGLQAKLLRVLQERRVRPLGSERDLEVDVRIMAATHRDLEEAVDEGDFRSDLYYRLGVVTLVVPPLRERREDIPVLVDAYLERFAAQLGRPVESVHARAMEALARYRWPGNVRELINVMERAVLLARGRELRVADLPESLSSKRRRARHVDTSLRIDLDQPLIPSSERVVERFEREYLHLMLEETGGRISDTAERAGINPRTLYNKMRLYGLDKEDYRDEVG